MDLDLWNCLGRVTCIIAKFRRTDLVIFYRGKTLSYSQINTVLIVQQNCPTLRTLI